MNIYAGFSCDGCIHEPPSSFGGKPCCCCERGDPYLDCYQAKKDRIEITDSKTEFIGQVIDIFEDFLAGHSYEFAGLSPDEVFLDGENYSSVSEAINELLEEWGIKIKEVCA